MEGGIGILLLLVIFIVGVVVAIALYVTGGAAWLGKTSKSQADEDGGDRRPTHKAPTSPTLEHTEFVGTRRRDDAD